MKRILIIDDDKDILGLLETHLKRNHEVICSNNGKDGIIKIKSCSPELILTDVIMPEMEGIEFIRKVRDINKDVPIIVMSGDSIGQCFSRACLNLGASEFLTKPFSLKQLDTIIEKHI